MPRWSRVLIILCCAGVFAPFRSRAGEAPTSQPAPAEWGQVINSLARAITSGSDSAAGIETLLPDSISIRKFGSGELINRSKIARDTEGMVALATRVYSWPTETIASDLAIDLRGFDTFPESLRKQFVPRDDSDIKRANAIARLWVNRVLSPEAGQLVGILVLWEPPPPVTTTSLLLGTTGLSEIKQPYFIMIKGIRTSDGQCLITQIVCGDANQALN